ncbi:DUF397 domain-containing protein [Nocardiopsis kunsanensis]|uniref:DUF397 domain-containing protein n=1 Tax=Nocardiopsis kunsanensis TaxID=141693 RepID=UPI0004777E88|nr:DUF397 domain-containing protein [Nocardiopsis kunsanensis]
MAELIFRKSSYSDRNNCVEVADASAGSITRETQAPAGDSAHFRTSSYSDRSDCVAFADTHGGALIRDSQHPDLEHLPFTATEWIAFLRTAET